jgi:hypothetical protein
MRDATINHTWNVYNALFDHLDMIKDQFRCKDLEKNPWISEFITAIDTGTEKLKDYYSKTGGLMETQYALARIPVEGPVLVVSRRKGFLEDTMIVNRARRFA